MKIKIALAIASLLPLTGCQFKQPPPQDRVNDIPLLVDEAMQKRDFERSTIVYPNGSAIAGSTGYMMETNSRIPYEATRATDPFVATGNILLLPITFPLSKPWKAREFSGAKVPPTYTAQPPLD